MFEIFHSVFSILENYNKKLSKSNPSKTTTDITVFKNTDRLCMSSFFNTIIIYNINSVIKIINFT